MIDLTPLDVRKKRGDFKKSLRGYDPLEVDGFLELVAERMEELVKANMTLEERAQRVTFGFGHHQAAAVVVEQLVPALVPHVALPLPTVDDRSVAGHLDDDGHQIVRRWSVGSVEIVNLLIERGEIRPGMPISDLENDGQSCVVDHRLDERDDVGHVVGDVRCHHHIGDSHLRGDVGPFAFEGLDAHRSPSGIFVEPGEHLEALVDADQPEAGFGDRE